MTCPATFVRAIVKAIVSVSHWVRYRPPCCLRGHSHRRRFILNLIIIISPLFLRFFSFFLRPPPPSPAGLFPYLWVRIPAFLPIILHASVMESVDRWGAASSKGIALCPRVMMMWRHARVPPLPRPSQRWWVAATGTNARTVHKVIHIRTYAFSH